MRLITYQFHREARAGAQINGHIIDLNRAYKAFLQHHQQDDELAVADLRVPVTTIGLLNGGETALNAVRQAVAFIQERCALGATTTDLAGILYPETSITILPPVLRPGKVIGLGYNYGAHAAEAGKENFQYPVLFQKTATALIGDGQAIVIPRISRQIDYEGELAIIIGKRAKYVAERDAFAYIAGYACANDVNCHDIQYRTPQWTSGVIQDTFGPLGPLVTRDEIPEPDNLAIKTILNGEVMQEGNTSGMNFHVPQIVSYISSLTTLEPGDVIFTGTPPGIGALRQPPVFLQPGDTITVQIEGLGTLTNPVIAESSII